MIIFVTILVIGFIVVTARTVISRINSKFNETFEEPTGIFCFWTGMNEMSENRKRCLRNLETHSECPITLITPSNVNEYILKDHPIHAAYAYLSETHKADYMRTYFMNFIGGGYSDIKDTTGSWKQSFHKLANNANKWICGYKEVQGGVGYPPLNEEWESLVGNGAYICKPMSILTREWYSEMVSLLDEKLPYLIQHPATSPRDCSENGNGYPIGWTEMLGRIFHKVSYKYKDHVMNTLPISVFENYI